MLAVSGFYNKHNCMCHARARVVIVPPIPGFFINIIACAMQGHFRSRQRLPSESEIDERIIAA